MKRGLVDRLDRRDWSLLTARAAVGTRGRIVVRGLGLTAAGGLLYRLRAWIARWLKSDQEGIKKNSLEQVRSMEYVGQAGDKGCKRAKTDILGCHKSFS